MRVGVGEDDAFDGRVVGEEERGEDFGADGGEGGVEGEGWEGDVLRYALDMEEGGVLGLYGRHFGGSRESERRLRSRKWLCCWSSKKVGDVGGK